MKKSLLTILTFASLSMISCEKEDVIPVKSLDEESTVETRSSLNEVNLVSDSGNSITDPEEDNDFDNMGDQKDENTNITDPDEDDDFDKIQAQTGN